MSSSKNKLLKGTLILTVAGFITRIIGFIYKIYLADFLGATYLGLYQLIFPVYAICFTIYGAGIQTAISQVIAASLGKVRTPFSYACHILLKGLCLGLLLALTLSFFVQWKAEWIALHFVMEASLAPYLRILAWLFPFCCISACVNGFYYGIQEAKVPAISQLIEQLARVCFVFFLSGVLSVTTKSENSCELAVWGLVIGEAAACVYNIAKILPYLHHMHYPKKRTGVHISDHSTAVGNSTSFGNFVSVGSRTLYILAFSLTLTRLLITFLNSVESVLLPAMLRKYGCSASDALGIYGVLTGMTMSFLLFPSTITNSLAVMLVPSVAEAYGEKHHEKIKQSVNQSMKYSILMGIFSTCIFLIFGKDMGILFFHNEAAGTYLICLSWLCPFLYLGTTLNSIINGMEKTYITFLFTAISLGIKIAILILAVPIWGIRAYLIGMLCSQLILVSLQCIYLHRYIEIDAMHCIVLPGILLTILGYAFKHIYTALTAGLSNWESIFIMGIMGVILVGIYLVELVLTQTISVRKKITRNHH